MKLRATKLRKKDHKRWATSKKKLAKLAQNETIDGIIAGMTLDLMVNSVRTIEDYCELPPDKRLT